MFNKRNVAESAMGNALYEGIRWTVRWILPSVLPVILCFREWVRTAPPFIVVGFFLSVWVICFVLLYVSLAYLEKRFSRELASKGMIIVPPSYPNTHSKTLISKKEISGLSIIGCVALATLCACILHQTPIKNDGTEIQPVSPTNAVATKPPVKADSVSLKNDGAETQPVSPTNAVATKPPVKAGSVSLRGAAVRAGDGNQGPGGDVRIGAGDGSNGASGGDINIGPGVYRAGDAGSNGKGGDLIIKAGDAK